MPLQTVSGPVTLTAFRGLPASGKSTQARAMVRAAKPGTMVRVNKDDLRAMMHGFHAGHVTESQIIASRNALVATHLSAGVDVVVDDTNIAMTHVNTLAAIAWEHGAGFDLVDLTGVDVEECIRRDTLRGEASVGEQVIRKMAKQLAARPNPPIPAHVPIDPVHPVDGLPHVVLCDVDGTLAHMTDRKPYHFARVGEDVPDPHVPQLVRDLLEAGRPVIVLSGRDESCRPQTQAWLDEHVAPGLPLFMRPAGDTRRDSLVKRDLFDAHIRGRFNVDFVLDDRDQVVRMWRALGVPCYQVAPGPF